MLVTKHCSTGKIALLAIVLAAIQPLPAQSASESDRLEKLERAVEQLQKRNTELEAEVRSLKQQTAGVPDSKFKTKERTMEKRMSRKLSLQRRNHLCLCCSGDRN